ncbi:hypothetical protein PsorP6_002586 [Peronosclerospora sorghi]|uniref:Uncharacterized protein n=1 Tax=Peronosclerospora sorghi TaxID=230839 RepID=A0ACC0WRL8_9STRA|nr:hypothetical protein PsorP6_002586 [Peronosclerospora sorghi]
MPSEKRERILHDPPYWESLRFDSAESAETDLSTYAITHDYNYVIFGVGRTSGTILALASPSTHDSEQAVYATLLWIGKANQ